MLAAALLCATFASPDITLDIDAREAQFGLVHTHETLAVKPGKLTLSYPKWHPGNHRPSGPINDMLNLRFRVNGSTIPWERDDVELYHFNIQIPAGASSLEIDFDDASQPGTTFTPHLARLAWNRYLLYPAGRPSDAVMVQSQVSLPAGWTLATPLLRLPTGGNQIPLRTVSLTELVDSPGLAGQFFKRVDLSTDEALDIAGETADSIAISSEAVADSIRLVSEARALFGARHYRHYDFLLSASNVGGRAGLEHHECSEDGTGLNELTNPRNLMGYGELIAHEYTHSWNGKYRRPAGLATPTYDDPMKGDLLWVYEGMTQFWGKVLAARSGFETPEQFRQELANSAAFLSVSGRNWRTVEDTAISSSILRDTARVWSTTRRGQDYYEEPIFLWLDVDAAMRRLSGGKKSIDDFCKLFHGGKSGPPMVNPYHFEDVVADLNTLVPYDWATLLRTRISTLQPDLNLTGLESHGWKLVWSDSAEESGRRRRGNGILYSLGLSIDATGLVTDTILTMPGGTAGVRPGMRIQTVKGQKFSEEQLLQALRDRKEFDLGIEYGGETRTLQVPYASGLKLPHLERIPTVPDTLSDLIKPHAS